MIYEPTSSLTDHFRHREISKSSTANRLGIDNTPTPEVLERALLLSENILEPVRVHFGIPFSPQSWFRCEALEKELTKNSFPVWCKKRDLDPELDDSWNTYFNRKSHPKGEAADIEVVGISNDVLYEWIKANLEFDQLIREFPRAGDPMSGWVHVSWRKLGNRNQAFKIGAK